MDFPKSSGIYLIKNIQNGRCYIGQSQNIYRRIGAHKRLLRSNKHYNYALQKEWNKYGQDSFDFSVVELCDTSILDEREIYYIKTFNAYQDGYNYDEGGNTRRGYVMSEEARAKMRAHHHDVSGKNNPMYGVSLYDILNEEEIAMWKHRISMSNRGEKNHSFGKTLSPEAKAKISAANKGRLCGTKNPNYGKTQEEIFGKNIKAVLKAYQEKAVRGNNPNARPVVLLNTEEIFDCIGDAADKYDAHRSSISSCCANKIYSAGVLNNERLVWAYLDDYNGMSEEDISNKIKQAQGRMCGENHPLARSVICLTTGLIFKTAKEAADYYNTDNSTIGKVCKGKAKSSGVDPISQQPLRWMYYKDYLSDQANQATPA